MAAEGRRRAARVEEQSRFEPEAFADREQFLRWCGDEWPNLNAVIQSAARSADHVSTWRLTYLLFDYFDADGSAADWLDLLKAASRAADACGDPRARALVRGDSCTARARIAAVAGDRIGGQSVATSRSG
ncbi:MAG TPA: hypothetical protein VGM10_04810 [Actinocrinis sp.]|jgi:hypothetical protein